MITFTELSKLLAESTPLPQTHDASGVQRFFPELFKNKKNKAKKAHDVQEPQKKVVSVKKDGDVVVNESKHHYTVVGRFGEVKYKNIKQAQRTASAPIRKPNVPIHRNYAPKKNYHLSKGKMASLEKAVGYKKPKPLQKFSQFTSKVRSAVTNPVATVKSAVGGAIKKAFTPKKQPFTPTTQKYKPNPFRNPTQRTAGSVIQGSSEPEIKKPKFTKTTQPKQQKTAGDVVGQQ